MVLRLHLRNQFRTLFAFPQGSCRPTFFNCSENGLACFREMFKGIARMRVIRDFSAKIVRKMLAVFPNGMIRMPFLLLHKPGNIAS